MTVSDWDENPSRLKPHLEAMEARMDAMEEAMKEMAQHIAKHLTPEEAEPEHVESVPEEKAEPVDPDPGAILT